MVTDSQLTNHLRKIILTSDLWTTTATAIIRRLQADLGVDLYQRRMFIMKQIDELVYGRSDGAWDTVDSDREYEERGDIGRAVRDDAVGEDPELGPSASDEGEGEDEEEERSKVKKSMNERDKTEKDGLHELPMRSPQLHDLLGVTNQLRVENMASETIVVDLNTGEKLNGDNYETWRHKIWYVLDEQDALEGIYSIMHYPCDGNTTQSRKDQEAYQAWKKRDSIARSILVSSVVDDLIHECAQHPTAHDIWMYLREKYGGISVRQLIMEFDTYKKREDHSIKEHLRTMSGMIRELRLACQFLSDKQQVQALIRSLPDNWKHLKVDLTHDNTIKTFTDAARRVELEDMRLGDKFNMTHNDTIKDFAYAAHHVKFEDVRLGSAKVDMIHTDNAIMTYVDVPRHVELKGARLNDAKVNITRIDTNKNSFDTTRHKLKNDKLGAVKSSTGVIVREFNSKRFLNFKRRKNWKNGKKETHNGERFHWINPNLFHKNKKRKLRKQNDKSKMKCFICYDLGHFARECSKQNKVWVQGTT